MQNYSVFKRQWKILIVLVFLSNRFLSSLILLKRVLTLLRKLIKAYLALFGGALISRSKQSNVAWWGSMSSPKLLFVVRGRQPLLIVNILGWLRIGSQRHHAHGLRSSHVHVYFAEIGDAIKSQRHVFGAPAYAPQYCEIHISSHDSQLDVGMLHDAFSFFQTKEHFRAERAASLYYYYTARNKSV